MGKNRVRRSRGPKRTNNLQIRLSDAELQELARHAALFSLSTSAWARMVLIQASQKEKTK